MYKVANYLIITRHLALVAAMTVLTSVTPVHSQTGWKPERNVEFVVQTAPGGGTDITSRLIQKIWQERRMVEVPVVINNKAGGGGNVALAYLKQHPGDSHFLQIASSAIVTNHIAGASTFHYTDFTQLAQLTSEYIVFAVKADSPIRTGKDIVARLGKDPASMSIAIGTAAGGVNHAAAALVAKAGGSDVKKLKVVVSKSSAESVTLLLGGHVDLAVSSASVVTPYAPGQVRLVAISAPRRIEGPLAAVPTWKEQGFDIIVDNFRMVVGPPGMGPAQIAYWEAVFARLVQSEEWKKDLQNNQWENNYMGSRESRKYLDGQYEQLRRVLSDLGMAK